MQIIGVDLHTRQQTIAMLDTATGEVTEKELKHEGETVREFYAALAGPVQVGIEATGSMYWFLELMDASWGSTAGWVIHRKFARRRHASRSTTGGTQRCFWKLQIENRFPSIWMPSTALRDLRTLLMHRHQWVRMRTRVQNALQAMALSRGLRRGKTLWSKEGQHAIESLPLPPNAAYRRAELQGLYRMLQEKIEELDKRVKEQAMQRPGAKLLMTHPGVGPVTALATDVFLGDPTRFADGKVLVSYVGIIPSEYSSGGQQRLGRLSKHRQPTAAFSLVRGRRARRTPRDPELQRFYRRKLSQKGLGKARVAAILANSGSACGLCCAIKSMTKSSVAAARCGRKTVAPVRGCQKWAIVLQFSDCETD